MFGSNWFGAKKNSSTNVRTGNASSVVSASSAVAQSPASALYGSEAMKQTTIVLIILFGIFVLTLLIMFIVSRVRKSKLREVVLQPDMLTLDDSREIPFKADASKMDLANAGQEFSLNFWIYLNPKYEATSNHKLVLARGVLPDTANGNVDFNANPIVFMDKSTNRMYIALSTNLVTSANISLNDIIARDVQGRYVNGFVVSYVDYVPLQRWVNVSITVRDNSAYVFVDADMYSAMTVNDILLSKVNKRPIIRGTNGDLVIGSRSATVNGYIAYTSYYNYALTQKEIRNIYSRGPYPKSLLSFIGLSSYGLRSPLYKIE